MHINNAVTPKNLPDGPWKILLKEALKIIDDLEVRGGIAKPFWTFGGGTVLMLRYGHTATARDLFDLALVIEKDSENLKTAAEYLKKNRQPFLSQLESRQQILEVQFNAINALNYKPTFKESFESAQAFLNKL